MGTRPGRARPGPGDAHGFLADVEQLATKLLATAVEQLHSVSGRHAQHAANVVGLGFGQLVLAEAQGRR